MPAAVLVPGEAEAVGSDNCAVLENDVVAELAVLADYSMGVRKEAIADTNAGIQDDVGQDDGVVADDTVFADDDIRADVGASADFCRGVDDSRGVNAGRPDGRLVKDFDGASEAEIGIF